MFFCDCKGPILIFRSGSSEEGYYDIYEELIKVIEKGQQTIPDGIKQLKYQFRARKSTPKEYFFESQA